MLRAKLRNTKEQPSWFNPVDLPFSYLGNTLYTNTNNTPQRVEGLCLKAKSRFLNPCNYGFTDYRQEPLTQTRLSGGRQKGWPARKEQASSFPLTLGKELSC